MAIKPPEKNYDYLLKILLVGDNDVGKNEILRLFHKEANEIPFCFSNSPERYTTTLVVEGKCVKLQLWDTSGQGRLGTIMQSCSRGAQGVCLVYDITNKWSFDGIRRWMKQIDELAMGIPKVLLGNRCHLAHKRKVSTRDAETYANLHNMAFFELSPLCNFNVLESFSELCRIVLKRNVIKQFPKPRSVSSLGEIALDAVAKHSSLSETELLQLPNPLRSQLCQLKKSMAKTETSCRNSFIYRKRRQKIITPDTSKVPNKFVFSRHCAIM